MRTIIISENVKVYQYDDGREPEINWSAIGPQPAIVVLRFLADLVKALELVTPDDSRAIK